MIIFEQQRFTFVYCIGMVNVYAVFISIMSLFNNSLSLDYNSQIFHFFKEVLVENSIVKLKIGSRNVFF